jgi:hypothetical protein
MMKKMIEGLNRCGYCHWDHGFHAKGCPVTTIFKTENMTPEKLRNEYLGETGDVGGPRFDASHNYVIWLEKKLCSVPVQADNGKALRNIIVKSLDQWFPANNHGNDPDMYRERQQTREGLLNDIMIDVLRLYFPDYSVPAEPKTEEPKKYNVTVYRNGSVFGFPGYDLFPQDVRSYLIEIRNRMGSDVRLEAVINKIILDINLGGKPSKTEYNDDSGYWKIVIDKVDDVRSEPDGFARVGLGETIHNAINRHIPNLADPMRQIDQQRMKNELQRDIFISIVALFPKTVSEGFIENSGPVPAGKFRSAESFVPYNKVYTPGNDPNRKTTELNYDLSKELITDEKVFSYHSCSDDEQSLYTQFAITAMQGILSGRNNVDLDDEWIARNAYNIAEAMIMEERRRTKV